MTNPLVAQAPQEGSGFTQGTGDNGWATGISIAESAMDTFNGFKEGNWIEGGLGLVGLAADAASMAVDPFGTLMSSAASFLMEHVQPLKDMLDWLAGDPPVIESYSTTWTNVSTELGKISEDYAAALASGTEGWTGAAADAYRAAAAQQGDALSGAASAAGSVGTVVGVMGMVVAFVREMVRDLIADLIGKLIAWVLEAVFSLGFGTPVIVAQAITAISKWAARIAKLVQKLLDTIKKVSPMLKRLVEIFEKIMKVLGKLAGKATGLDVLGTKIDDPGFLKRFGRDGVDSPSGSRVPEGARPDGDAPSSRPDGDAPGSRPDGDAPGSRSDGDAPASTTPSTSTDTPSTRSPDGTPRSPGDTTPSSTTPTSPTATPSSPGSTPHGPASRGTSGQNPDSPPSGHSPSPTTSSAHSPSTTHSPTSPSSPGSTPSGHSPTPPNSPGSSPHSPTLPNSPGSTPSAHTPTSPNSPSPSPSPHSPTSPNSPGSTPSAHSPSPSPSHTPGGPGSAPSSHGPGGPPSPVRPDQTHSSATATPDAPSRVDPSHSAPRDTSPSSAPPQQGPVGGAPHGGGQPGGAPSAGGPPRTGGGGWTGTSGHRGDTASGVPQSRTADTTPRPQNAGPPRQPFAGPPPPRTHPAGPVHPPQAGPVRPPQAGPPHAGPPQTRPPHQGPPHPNTPHQNTPHQPQPRGPQPAAPHHAPDGPPHHPGTPQHHQPEPRPSIDEAHARHGETTPAGVSHHRGDSDMGDLPSRVPNDPRYFTADVHITPDGRARIGNHTYSPEEYGDLLRRSGWDGRTPIRLIGCDAGSNDFARRLAAHTDAPVLAPTKPAWTDSQGRVFTSDAEVDANGNRQPRIPPNGEWETHSPDGTRTRAGEDGFVPGTHDKDGLDPTDARDRAADDDGSSSDPDDADTDTPQYDPPIVTRRVPADEPPFANWTRPDDSAFDPPHADDPALRPLAGDEPFGSRQGPDQQGNYGLRPDTRYEVPGRGTFFTDGQGRIAWVEADGGRTGGNFNPDLNHPLPSTEYRVNDRWTFNTNEHGETESMSGTPDYDRSNRAARDGDAQERSADIGRAAYTGGEFEHVRWDGGHMAANNMGGPSEYINMFPQMRASNQGHYKDGYVHSESWRRMEMDLARLDRTPGCSVDQVQVRAERGPDGVPREVTFRWTQTTNGVTETVERTYPNVPRVNFGPQTPYPD